MALPAPVQDLFEYFAALSLVDLSWSLGVVVLGLLAGVLTGRLLGRAVARVAERTDTELDDAILARLRSPIRWLLPVVFFRGILPLTVLPESVVGFLGHLASIAIILFGAWMLARVVAVVEIVIMHRLTQDGVDNLRARAVHTQVRGFRNILRFAIGVLAVGLVLMTFDGVRRLGVSLLASAGVAGVVIGFAAQRSIATVVAGVQIAVSQPIRVDDVVIVEGEWGRIEEITLTYVVVSIWDQRRLIVPITYFIERPFQNWTRTTSELLGTVFLHVDYRVPVAAVRAELKRIVEASELWDRRAVGLVVTDARERTLELRALVSAADASKLWELRCHVREALVDYVQREHANCLPTVRAQLDAPAPARAQPS